MSGRLFAAILDTVAKIPRGKVVTYGEVARLAGVPGYARHVGYALHSLPPGSGIPWHRVINSQGRISFPAGSRHYKEQKRLLLEEGIEFKGNKINLKKHGLILPSRH